VCDPSALITQAKNTFSHIRLQSTPRRATQPHRAFITTIQDEHFQRVREPVTAKIEITPNAPVRQWVSVPSTTCSCGRKHRSVPILAVTLQTPSFFNPIYLRLVVPSVLSAQCSVLSAQCFSSCLLEKRWRFVPYCEHGWWTDGNND